MGYSVIIRRHESVQSYLVLDDNPREMLRHVGFNKEFSLRSWQGSTDPLDAREEWAEMLGEDPYEGNYTIVDSDNWEFITDAQLWADCVLNRG